MSGRPFVPPAETELFVTAAGPRRRRRRLRIACRGEAEVTRTGDVGREVAPLGAGSRRSSPSCRRSCTRTSSPRPPGYSARRDQRHCVPLRSRAGLLASAQTGSSKTVAFLIPLLASVVARGERGRARARGRGGDRRAAPSALVLAPTRELALQVERSTQAHVRRAAAARRPVGGGRVRRRDRAAAARGARARRGRRRRDAGAARRPSRARPARSRAARSSCSTRPTACSTWATSRSCAHRRGHDLPPRGAPGTLLFSAAFPPALQKVAAGTCARITARRGRASARSTRASSSGSRCARAAAASATSSRCSCRCCRAAVPRRRAAVSP